MKYVDEYRDQDRIKFFAEEIGRIVPEREIKIMEVCGGHTHNIHKYGLKSMLPSNVKLISGPGCPVCVTPVRFIDELTSLVEDHPNLILITFGELLRIPGSATSLNHLKAKGKDIRICYSAIEAIGHAIANPDKEIILAGVGFETTAPTVAAVLLEASKRDLKNFSVLSALKTMPEAMRVVLASGEIALDGMICPGHVSVITGTGIYDFIPRDFHVPCVVSGFEPLDIVQSVFQILCQVKQKKNEVQIEYKRAVNREGNKKASEILYSVFEECDADWRGFGVLKNSGLRIKKNYERFDAYKKFFIREIPSKENKGCICADIIRGAKEPNACKLFGKVCTPENPCGPCMVSDEGTCSAHYQYTGA